MPPSPLFKLSYTFKLKRNLFTAKIFHFRCEAKLTFMLFFIFTKEKKTMNFQIYLFKLKELKYFQIFVYYYTVTCNRLKYRITTNTGAFSIGLTVFIKTFAMRFLDSFPDELKNILSMLKIQF